MDILKEIFYQLVSHLPKLMSGWLYSPTRTKAHVEVTIPAREGSVDVFCDRLQSSFRIALEIRNANPFPIEVDRIEATAQLYSGSMRALELFGARVEKNGKATFYLQGRIDDANLERINNAPDNEMPRVHIRAVITNKYHCIRDFTCAEDRVMCRFSNRTRAQSPLPAAQGA